MPNTFPIGDFLSAVADRGRAILGIGTDGRGVRSANDIVDLCHKLLSSNGEASGLALSFEILSCYQHLVEDEKTAFFFALSEQFSADETSARSAAQAYLDAPTRDNLGRLGAAVEPSRRQLIIRMNQAPNATLLLIRMRGDLLDRLPGNPRLIEVDQDFAKLFASWFNGGFLELRSLDWTSPADLLENIMRYEAVHGMSGWSELRDRIAPADRLIYGFFHPRLGNEPLIFIEVALMSDMPSEIASILDSRHEAVDPQAARTAVFYSISNCQKGLRGIPLGSFLIKHVVEELKISYPQLKEFVTLSPVPGFASWLRDVTSRETGESGLSLSRKVADDVGSAASMDWIDSPEAVQKLKPTLTAAAAHYLAVEKDGDQRPIDPVAKFHLGNGARLQRINWPADVSENGVESSFGLMVNYRYHLEEIEQNHERFVRTGEVPLTAEVSKLAKLFEKEFEPA